VSPAAVTEALRTAGARRPGPGRGLHSYPRKRDFQATFALHRWLDSPRVVKKVDYGPRWRMHYLVIRAEADLDDELRGWLQESHDVVGLQTGLPGTA
jgi:hypothetical protein